MAKIWETLVSQLKPLKRIARKHEYSYAAKSKVRKHLELSHLLLKRSLYSIKRFYLGNGIEHLLVPQDT